MEALAYKENAPEGGSKMEIIFIIFGIGSLLAWNAILFHFSLIIKENMILQLGFLFATFFLILFFNLL